jgi:hypothetical protein
MTKQEWKVLFLIMVAASSEPIFISTFRERNIDRLALIEKMRSESPELTEQELKTVFLILCVVSSEYEATFRRYGLDRFAVIKNLQDLSGAE